MSQVFPHLYNVVSLVQPCFFSPGADGGGQVRHRVTVIALVDYLSIRVIWGAFKYFTWCYKLCKLGLGVGHVISHDTSINQSSLELG